MTSRFTLLTGVAGLIWLGCSSSGEGDIEDPPTSPPPGFLPGAGTGGTGQTGVAGTGGAPATTGGTGGTGGAPASAAGTGGAPAAAGTGGTGGAPPTGGDVPIGTGLAITPQADGWVPGMSNGLGIQGAFFSSSDADANPTGTTVNFDTTTTPGTVCVDGSVSVVPDANSFSTNWGALLGLNLHQVLPATGGEAQDPSAWPRATPAGTVTGFSYTLTANGGTPLPHLRFNVDFVGKTAGDTYCKDTLVANASSTSFSDVVASCWQAGGAALPTAADLLAIQWSIVSTTDGPVPFDFCVSNLQAIVTP